MYIYFIYRCLHWFPMRSFALVCAGLNGEHGVFLRGTKQYSYGIIGIVEKAAGGR